MLYKYVFLLFEKTESWIRGFSLCLSENTNKDILSMYIFDLMGSLNVNGEREIKIENKRKREEKIRDEEHDVYGNKN